MALLETEQNTEMKDLGFTEARQRRGLIKWVLFVSVSFNVILFKSYRETNQANEKVLHELIKQTQVTIMKVDSSINLIK